MKKLIILYSFLLLAASSFAQSGGCGVDGVYISFEDYVNYDRATGGDLEVDFSGDLEIGSAGNYDVYGALLNNGAIHIDSGGTLSIYGNVINNGRLDVHKYATLNFYGTNWKNGASAIVSDGALLANTIPGGMLNFTASRPTIPSEWITLSSCLTTYSGGSAIQFADGGNIPMDVDLHLKNSNNVLLLNSALRLEGKLSWDVPNGNIVLGNQDLIFSQNATQDGYQPDRFAVTSGTGHVVKENYTGNWVFPVGISSGDYTPAAINNTSTNTMHVLVQDYASSASDEVVSGPTADGMQRTWNIYADLASGNALINLQHNSATNQPAFNDAFNFVTRWSTTVPNPTGDFTVAFSISAWQTNNGAAGVIGNLSSAGPVTGSTMRSRTYSDFATNATDATAFFTKSSDPTHPLPVNLISFIVRKEGCSILISFETALEGNINKYQLQRSNDGVHFVTIANFAAKGDGGQYSFLDENPDEGKNLYRIIMVEPNGDYTRSPVKTIEKDCNEINPVIHLYPNPAFTYISLTGMRGESEIRVLDMMGKVVLAISTANENEMLDVSQLAAATYTVQVKTGKNYFKALKFLKL